jgi:hypothetical protein
MIICDFVKIVTCSTFCISYYKNLGYAIKKGEYIDIKIEDLPVNSSIKIEAKCDYCGKIKNISYLNYNRNFARQNKFSCSKKCSQHKTKDTNIKKYGVDNPSKNETIKENKKKTNIKKYGFESASQNEEVKNKIKNTNLMKYGVECNLTLDTVKEQIKRTNLKKYGVDNPAKNENIKNKIKETNIKKYGCHYTLGNSIIKEKALKTLYDNYGVTVPLKNENIKEKLKQTCLKKYGVNNPLKDENIICKMIKTNIDRYGEFIFKYVPKYNPLSICVFDEIAEQLNINIQHALNGGEKQFYKYFVDGFIQGYNIVLEWDEPKHFYKKQKEIDIKRQTYIENNFECKFIRINQKEYFSDEIIQFNLLVDNINNIIKTKKVHF